MHVFKLICFPQAREAGMPLSEDICSNLAHVHLAQGRFVDAEHLYQASLKTLPAVSSSSSGGLATKGSDKVLAAYECMAFAQYRHGRHSEAIRSLLRSLHGDPSVLRGWFNVGVVRCDLSTTSLYKKSSSVEDMDDGFRQLILAKKLFDVLGKHGALSGANIGGESQGNRAVTYASQASKKQISCEVRNAF